MISIPQTIRRLREARNLSTEEASKLIYVTRRTIELWEKGERVIPNAKLELYMAKLLNDYQTNKQLIVIVADDCNNIGVVPLDVISEDTFLSISEDGFGNAIIASMFVDRITRKPSVHRTKFSMSPHNLRAVEIANNWQIKIEMELLSNN